MSNKVLVLDDDPDILDIISYILSEKDYTVQTLARGTEVFETIKNFNPDLVLMDVMLGDTDGRVICRHLKSNEKTREIPVILISASHDLAQSLNQDGAPNDFIAKPFDIALLVEKVEKLLGG